MEKTKENFVGNVTAESIKKYGMVNVDGLDRFEPGQTEQSDIEPFYAFKECKNEEEYIRKHLASDNDTDNAYQLAYDMSNDWALEQPSWGLVQYAYLIGLAAAKIKEEDTHGK